LGRRADFIAITIFAIFAKAIVGAMNDGVVDLVARVVGTVDTIIEDGRRSGLAPARRIALLLTIAERVIRARGVIRLVNDYVIDLIADRIGTGYAVISRWRRTGLAVGKGVTGFFAVTILAVITRGMIAGVHHEVVDFVASVGGAAYVVI